MQIDVAIIFIIAIFIIAAIALGMVIRIGKADHAGSEPPRERPGPGPTLISAVPPEAPSGPGREHQSPLDPGGTHRSQLHDGGRVRADATSEVACKPSVTAKVRLW